MVTVTDLGREAGARLGAEAIRESLIGPGTAATRRCSRCWRQTPPGRGGDPATDAPLNRLATRSWPRVTVHGRAELRRPPLRRLQQSGPTCATWSSSPASGPTCRGDRARPASSRDSLP